MSDTDDHSWADAMQVGPDPAVELAQALLADSQPHVEWRSASPEAQAVFRDKADALMPVVRQYAAEEIERIADERTWTTEHDNEVVSTRDLYEHVARLRGELEPVTYDFPPDDSGQQWTAITATCPRCAEESS